jgi:hypothetical protein
MDRYRGSLLYFYLYFDLIYLYLRLLEIVSGVCRKLQVVTILALIAFGEG